MELSCSRYMASSLDPHADVSRRSSPRCWVGRGAPALAPIHRLMRTPADHQPSSPERGCPMTRLRTMLLALAVAALLLVATASAALAGITARGVD